jgi:hypothetical protein
MADVYGTNWEKASRNSRNMSKSSVNRLEKGVDLTNKCGILFTCDRDICDYI